MQSMTWVEPVANFRYREATAAVSADHQSDKLAACGLDPEAFGEFVDPSFFIGIAIHAGINSGISAEGNVNMLQRLIQHRPVLLDEPLTVHGVITAVTEVPRGRTIDTEVWFNDAHGRRVISAHRRSLKPDNRGRGAGERPPPVITDTGNLAVSTRHRLTPERVQAYSSEGNSIHYDMAAANRAGFRAPLIGGGMGVHYLMAVLWRPGPPNVLDLDIYFRRPIFWDAAFAVAITPDRRAICLYDEAAGRVLTEARINRLEHQAIIET